MPNTYTQIYMHIVFAVRHRRKMIPADLKTDVHRYIGGVIRNQNHKLLIINSMPDHMHILLGMRPDCSLSNLVRDIKADSSRLINQRQSSGEPFAWQSGFGAFSCGHAQLQSVIRYIEHQEEHHARTSFTGELRELLRMYDVAFDERYLPITEE